MMEQCPMQPNCYWYRQVKKGGIEVNDELAQVAIETFALLVKHGFKGEQAKHVVDVYTS